MYPYLSDWLSALRNSENGLMLVLCASLVSLMLLACYRWLMPDELPKVRTTMIWSFIIVSVVLVFVVG